MWFGYLSFESTPMMDIVVRGIRERRLLWIVYKGHMRIVEPHTLFDTRDGDTVLNCWQVYGYSESQGSPGWRNFSLSEVESVDVLARRFPGPRPGYEPHSPKFARVHATL